MSIKIDMIDCYDLDCAYNIHYKCTSEFHNIVPKGLFGQNLECDKKISLNKLGETNAK